MKKLNNVSLLRIISMLFIFVFHVVLGLINNIEISHYYFPLYFAIQIFMFISGYLFSNKNIKSNKEHFITRFSAILTPYYIYMLFLLVLYLIFDISQITLPIVLRSIFCFHFLYEGCFSIEHFWYIFIALICYLFVPILIKLREDYLSGNTTLSKNKRFFCWLFVVLIVVGELVATTLIQSQITMTCFMIGFLFGVNKNFSKENPSQNVWYFKKDKFKILACFVLFAISSGIYYLFNCNYNTLLPNFIEYFANGVSVAIMGVTFSIIFLSLFKFLNNKQLPKVLTFIDSTSYHFYITHHAFVVSSGNLLYSLNLTNFVWLNIILAFIFSMLSAYLLKCISNLVLKNIKKLTLLK